MILEPLRMLGQRADGLGLLGVDVEDERLPGALHAARIHVHLGETVDRVDRRLAVGDPGDVVRPPVGRLARPIPLRQRRQRLRHRLAGVRHGRLQVLHYLGDLRAVTAVDPVHLLVQPAVALHQARVERIALLEVGDVGHRHAVVQVVRAREQQVLTSARGLVGDDGIHVGIEEQRLESAHELIEVLAVAEGQARAGRRGRAQRRPERLRRQVHDESARREVVERTGVDPEELGVAVDFLQHRRLDRAAVDEELFEHLPHLQVVDVALVVEDVAPGERGMVQVPDEGLLAQGEGAEAVGVDLDDRRVVDALEQIRALGLDGGRRISRGRIRRAAAARRAARDHATHRHRHE